MAERKDRILIVESDPIVTDLVARQALKPQGYEIKVVTEANQAIQQAVSFSPDVVIANLELPGLSGKDLLVALAAQSVDVPVIMIAARGKERDVIQAFRLGASDYLGSPVRETEVVSAVERALKQVHARRERERLQVRLQQTNRELEKRVKELTTLFAIGKAMNTIAEHKELFNRVLDGAIRITEADIGWLLVKDERTQELRLTAHLGLPKSLTEHMNEPWDDGVSALVAMSGEPLALHGDSLRRFKIAALGKSALIMPVKVQEQTIALLVVMRQQAREFSTGEQAMLEAVSDYASISLVNARLFRALDERAASLQKIVEKAQKSEKLKDDIIEHVTHELREPLISSKGYVDIFITGEMGMLKTKQMEAMRTTQNKLQRAIDILDAMALMHSTATPNELQTINLNDLANQAIGRFQKKAQARDIQIVAELSSEALKVSVDSKQIMIVLDALLSNAIKFSPANRKIIVRTKRARNKHLVLSVADQGKGINAKNLNHVFDRFFQVDSPENEESSGVGIGLSLVKEIMDAHGGKVWAESKLETGSVFSFSLPPAK
jgi:signal transduction histidine kinase/DNA-binding response OmpR family regulator